MSIRWQLLLIALATLILPWAGCQYARELELVQRAAQEDALVASAATIAQALSAEPARVFAGPADGAPYSPAQGDWYVFPLRNPPLLDGYVQDWDLPVAPATLPSSSGYAARVLLGEYSQFLYLYLEVDDARIVPEPATPHAASARFSRVDITCEGPDGALASYFFATPAPGPLPAQTTRAQDDGAERVSGEPRIQAFWLQTAAGYHLEARVPLALAGRRFWIEARAGLGDRQAGVAPNPARGGRLFMPTPGLDALLATFVKPGTRASVVNLDGLKLGTAGALDAGADPSDAANSWYRRFVRVDTTRWPRQAAAPERIDGASVQAALRGRARAEWQRAAGGAGLILVAATPIERDGTAAGAVVLEQSGEQLLALRDQALTHLLNRTLIATGIAVVFAFAVATSIGITIGRLRAAADSALGADGRIRLTMPESGRGDEIGALARAFERLLARLNEHALYLRSLGGKLAHELRTPLSIVRSSLENLESEGIRADQQGYLQRARDGIARLQFILSALGAAARVEESIKQAEPVLLDLNPVLAHAVAGYRDAFPGAAIDLQTPAGECLVRGAPELIVQLLDKLVENAVDFCPPRGRIAISLVRAATHYALSVSNDGPLIPAGLRERLFESLFEHRPDRDDRPHFGLGLYIVRLIAEFHGGRAVAANRDDGSGVTFTVELPFI